MALALIELRLSYQDFLELTPFDLAYLYEKNREREMVKFTLMRNTFANAYLNVNRAKNEKFIPLFEEIEGDSKKEIEKSPDELRKEREEFFNMVQQLGGC